MLELVTTNITAQDIATTCAKYNRLLSTFLFPPYEDRKEKLYLEIGCGKAQLVERGRAVHSMLATLVVVQDHVLDAKTGDEALLTELSVDVLRFKNDVLKHLPENVFDNV